jgi:hypothetical protein
MYKERESMHYYFASIDVMKHDCLKTQDRMNVLESLSDNFEEMLEKFCAEATKRRSEQL